MKNFVTFILLIILASSCMKSKNSDKASNDAFEKVKEKFIATLWQHNPGWASSMGLHQFDTLLLAPTQKNIKSKNDAYLKIKNQLDSIKSDELSPSNKTDFGLIANYLSSHQFYQNELKSYEWDPSEYNVLGGFAEIINGTYAPLSERLNAVFIKLTKVSDYYDAAKQLIKNPSALHTKLAISQLESPEEVLGKSLMDSVKAAGFDENQQAEFQKRMDKAITSISSFRNYLEVDILPTATHDFRIGKDLFNKKFALEINSGVSADEVYNNAIAEKDSIHKTMEMLAEKLWSKYGAGKEMPKNKKEMIRIIIDSISLHHCKASDFVTVIKNQIPEIESFVNKNGNIITLDPSKPLVVRETPSYMDGVAGASISSPGPYDKNGNTYYNVSPLNDVESAESYLKEYNDYMLKILNVHEAIPGHYTQLIYANESPSLVKSILGNGAMIEGWACYVERMMLQEGWGGNEDELWLMYYKWNLRIVCNTILDYSIHTKNMSEKEALNLLMNEAFQQEAEAKAKWKRACLSQVQLCSYYSGLSAIYNFRERLKTKLGNDFNLKKFHEKFLSYGSAPVNDIVLLMENDLGLNENKKEK